MQKHLPSPVKTPAAGESRFLKEAFNRICRRAAESLGSPAAFGLAMVVIVLWAVLGPLYHYSDTWQLVVNTGTSIATFLMVFLIQNTQNRDAKAIHLKLDELIRAMAGARNHLVDLERMTDEEMEELKTEFARIKALASRRIVPEG